MFLLLYYTDVVGISAATAGTLFLVVRVWDGFADLFAGRIVDQHLTRAGGSSAPTCSSARCRCCCSTSPSSPCPDLGDTGKLVYAYVSYALFGLAYSLVNIPYGSLATAMTQDPDERSKLATFRVVGANLAILLLAVVVSPQIEGSDDLQRSLTITTIVLAVVGTGALPLHVLHQPRAGAAQRGRRVSVRETFAARSGRTRRCSCSASRA